MFYPDSLSVKFPYHFRSPGCLGFYPSDAVKQRKAQVELQAQNYYNDVIFHLAPELPVPIVVTQWWLPVCIVILMLYGFFKNIAYFLYIAQSHIVSQVAP